MEWRELKIKIPARVFAVAAEKSADYFNVDAADIFQRGTHAASRARCVAVAAMVHAFPKIRRRTVGQGFGINMDQNSLMSMVRQARKQSWWDESKVHIVAAEILASLNCYPGPPHIQIHDNGDIAFISGSEERRTAESVEYVASAYVPRKWKPARLINPALSRRGNVTSAFLGDPPQGRREMIAAMSSPRYPGMHSREA
jgi:hypothetical protein